MTNERNAAAFFPFDLLCSLSLFSLPFLSQIHFPRRCRLIIERNKEENTWVHPILNKEAKNKMDNCLSSQKTECLRSHFFHSLHDKCTGIVLSERKVFLTFKTREKTAKQQSFQKIRTIYRSKKAMINLILFLQSVTSFHCLKQSIWNHKTIEC